MFLWCNKRKVEIFFCNFMAMSSLDGHDLPIYIFKCNLSNTFCVFHIYFVHLSTCVIIHTYMHLWLFTSNMTNKGLRKVRQEDHSHPVGGWFWLFVLSYLPSVLFPYVSKVNLMTREMKWNPSSPLCVSVVAYVRVCVPGWVCYCERTNWLLCRNPVRTTDFSNAPSLGKDSEKGAGGKRKASPQFVL